MINIINLIIMIVLGLFVAIIIYPALHEFGHMFIAIIVGADLVEFNLFPIPNVLFDVGKISIASNVMIGAGGVILPFILSVTINSKRFWLWYIGLIINIICCVSFIISVLGCALFSFSKPIENEDISQMLNFCPNTVILWMILFIILIAYTVIRICKSHPLKRCIEYFEL